MMQTNDFQANAPVTTVQQPGLNDQRHQSIPNNTNTTSLHSDHFVELRHKQQSHEDENSSLMNLLSRQQQEIQMGMGGIIPAAYTNPVSTNAIGSSSLANNASGSIQQQQMNNFMLPQSLMNNHVMASIGGLNIMNQTAMPNEMPNSAPQAPSIPNLVPSTARASNAQRGSASSSSSASAFERLDLGHSIAFRDSSPPMGGNGNNFKSSQQAEAFMNKQHPQQGSMNSFQGPVNSMNMMNQMNSFLQKNPQALNSISLPTKNNDNNMFNNNMMDNVPQKIATNFMDSMPQPLATAGASDNTTGMPTSPPMQMPQPQQSQALSQAVATVPSNLSSSQEDPGWEQQYKALREYHLQTGNCRVPARFKANPRLGRWVMTQRRQFTLLMQGQTSALTVERIRKLESLGFIWSVRPEPVATWNEKFNELKAYKANYGSCMVPQRYQTNPQLGTWVHTQWRQYKLMSEGKKSSMTQEKINALNSLGFDWDAKHTPTAQQGSTPFVTGTEDNIKHLRNDLSGSKHSGSVDE